MNQYDCRNATNSVATFRIKFGKKLNNFRQVFAYATFDDAYVNLIEEGEAEKTLDIYCPNNRLIRTLQFPAPVKQVMSCRHHQGRAEEDKIYILLWNGNIFKVGIDQRKSLSDFMLKVSGSLLEDPEVNDDALDLSTVFTSEGDDDDEDDDGEYKGFCVYGKKIFIYGYDGLHTLDLMKRRKSHRSIRVIKQNVINPIFRWFEWHLLGLDAVYQAKSDNAFDIIVWFRNGQKFHCLKYNFLDFSIVLFIS